MARSAREIGAVVPLSLALCAIGATPVHGLSSGAATDALPPAVLGNVANAIATLGFAVPARTVSVEAKINRCRRVKSGAYLCPARVHYRIETGNPPATCSAPIVARRWTWRFPAEKATCPRDWLPARIGDQK